ncbi:MAG TPA: FliA/WhiG family RNA polymerase sigma factor [Phycisphaerae bacterium]|nr:FliA/WhiG family RNA polymerase sigma factor [Phycisphaerales bacterium]HNO77935.1 FliA/WhiG family RNA polymerase sigma factor [Phycisphaerae bacterium]
MPALRTGSDVLEVWKEYKLAGGRPLRNRLMETYLPIVKYTADRISTKLPDEVDVDDLVSAGIFGLVDAIEAYDMERGVKFETYCAPRIRGAMLDELRAMDWVPRLVRSRANKLQRVCSSLEAELRRQPTDSELAKKLGVSKSELAKIVRDATAVSQISLSRKHFETDSSRDVCEIDVLEDKRGRNPVAEVQKRDLKSLITRGLTRAERLILILYYYEEMTMKEIGATLDLSESRVSQMHSAILNRLKSQLKNRERELSRA